MLSSLILLKNEEELTSMVGEIEKTRDSIFLMVVSFSWTQHSSTSSPWLVGWLIFLSFGYHTVFRDSILVFGQCCQLHSMSPVCSSEFIQLISTTILLSLHFMFSFLDLAPYMIHSDHSVSIMIPISCCWWGIYQGLLWWVTSCWHQHIIQEVDLETPLGALRLVYINGKFPHSRQ